MADETNEDDSWLYGLSNADSQTGNEKETNQNIAVQAECDSSQDPQDGQIDEQLVRIQYHMKTPKCRLRFYKQNICVLFMFAGGISKC